MVRFKGILFLSVFIYFYSGVFGQNRLKRYTITEEKMGSPFTLIVYGEHEVATKQVIREAFKRVDSLNEIFSDYLEKSELNILSSKSGSKDYLPVSTPLFQIISRSQEASVQSGGAFDITMGPVIHLWREARKQGRPPARSAIKKALKKTGYQSIILHPRDTTVRLKKRGMKLDLGGIAKGWIAQDILSFLKRRGYPTALINAGGDLSAGDRPPDSDGWKVGVSTLQFLKTDQKQILLLENRTVATSGDQFQHLDWEGKSYSHIINPKTGTALTNQKMVTIVSKDGALSDWLASACSILSTSKALSLVQKFPTVGILIIEKKDNHYKEISNHQFKRLLSPVN